MSDEISTRAALDWLIEALIEGVNYLVASGQSETR